MSDMPNLFQQAANLKEAYDKWSEAGKPLRTPEQVAELFAICEQCPIFMRISKDIGRCKSCGCWLKRSGENFNKLAWPTEGCPEGHWKADIDDGLST